MKANVKENELILSIGMIVKNEEKDLGGCLESLKPLMKSVPSELIIVDTGSTDATVEIARKYTDLIYDFEWIDDFSAARNYGVDKAKGMWFLQVDADDRLQDPTELIRFLNNKTERKKYYTAEIVYHSYLNKEYTQFSDSRIIRLFRLGVGNRFSGSIHEVPKRIIPTKELTTVFDHYGYLYETPEAAQRKRDRNNALLEKELEAAPDNIRLIDHYVASCPDEKKMDLLQHARELCKKQPNHYYFSNIYWKLTRCLYIMEKYQEVIEVSEEYFSLTTQDHVGDIEMRFHFGNACYKLCEYDKAAEQFERYLDLFRRYQDGSLQMADNMCATAERASLQNQVEVLCYLAHSYRQVKEYEKALDTVGKIPFKHLAPDTVAFFQQLIREALAGTGNYAALFDLEVWSSTPEAEEANRKSMTAFLVDRCLEIFGSEKWDALQQAASGRENSLAKAVLASSETASEDLWRSMSEEFSKNWELLEAYSPLLLAAGMRYGRDLMPLLRGVGRDRFTQLARRATEKIPNIAKLWAQYRPTEEEDILWRAWAVELDGNLFQMAGEMEKLPATKRMMKDLSWYVNRLYNPELLCPEKIEILPSAHRFGYWAGLALDAEKAGNDRDYIRYLREAARSCPEMADAVKLLLKEFEENNGEFQRRKEREQLAQKIKGMIEGMILGGQAKEAKSILEQYEMIAPDDTDISSLKAAILRQAPFPEI